MLKGGHRTATNWLALLQACRLYASIAAHVATSTDVKIASVDFYVAGQAVVKVTQVPFDLGPSLGRTAHGPADGLVTGLRFCCDQEMPPASELRFGIGTIAHAAGTERAALPLEAHVAGARVVGHQPHKCYATSGS